MDSPTTTIPPAALLNLRRCARVTKCRYTHVPPIAASVKYDDDDGGDVIVVEMKYCSDDDDDDD